jgi:beta-lactamase class D
MKTFKLLYICVVLMFARTAYSSQLACDNFQISITTYDLKTDKWFYSDEKESNIGTLPASTFKIFNSLIAIDSGATTTDEIFKWDQIKRSFPQWNQDLGLQKAFDVSAIWVHELLAKRISPSTYQRYLEWSRYGNSEIQNGKNGNFWVYGDFKITPIEQIKMLQALYENKLPFSKSTMEIVKSFMRSKEHIGIYAKSGWIENDNGTEIGWWIGWKLQGKLPVFFATRIKKPKSLESKDFLSCRMSLTLKHLDQKK